MSEEKQKDALDRLLDAVESLQGAVKMISADTEVTREAVHVVRDRMTSVEERLSVLERAEHRHNDFKRQVTDADAKIASDQAAFVIALQETRLAATEARELSKEALGAARLAAAASSKGLTALATVKTGQEQANANLAEIKTEEQKKPKVPVALAAILNLAVGLVYVVLELLRRAGH